MTYLYLCLHFKTHALLINLYHCVQSSWRSHSCSNLCSKCSVLSRILLLCFDQTLRKVSGHRVIRASLNVTQHTWIFSLIDKVNILSEKINWSKTHNTFASVVQICFWFLRHCLGKPTVKKKKQMCHKGLCSCSWKCGEFYFVMMIFLFCFSQLNYVGCRGRLPFVPLGSLTEAAIHSHMWLKGLGHKPTATQTRSTTKYIAIVICTLTNKCRK